MELPDSISDRLEGFDRKKIAIVGVVCLMFVGVFFVGRSFGQTQYIPGTTTTNKTSITSTNTAIVPGQTVTSTLLDGQVDATYYFTATTTSTLANTTTTITSTTTSSTTYDCPDSPYC